MARIAVTDGMDEKAVQRLEKAGHEVVLEHIAAANLLGGALDAFDAIDCPSCRVTREVDARHRDI